MKEFIEEYGLSLLYCVFCLIVTGSIILFIGEIAI
jgi:hypothetical protein